MPSIHAYAAGFSEEPGYLDFAALGPLAATVLAEGEAQRELLSRARFGSLADLADQDARARRAVAEAIGFHEDSVVSQPNTSTGLMHAMFGLTGGVLMSPAEFPALTYAAVRAQETLGVVAPIWLHTDHGRVTPGQIREQLTSTTAAVAVSLVDARTGYLADIEGIRQVIGDRLLIVDAVQGFGVVDAPYPVTDVVASGGQKWVRAGLGTGFLALSDRALEHLIPVFSGHHAVAGGQLTWDTVQQPERSAAAFQLSSPDYSACARFAAAVEEITAVSVAAINDRITSLVSALIDLADEFAVPVVSSRNESERAGIVVVEPPADSLTLLTAALFNHGVTATVRQGRVRFSVHASTTQESFDMLRAAFTAYSSARRPGFTTP